MSISPLSFRGPSVAREPGIHNHRPGVMDSGLATSWRPGMTADPLKFSLKGHADPLLGAPSYVAGAARSVRLDGQVEGIGDADAGPHLQAGARLGQVADGAGDHREPLIEHDPAGLQGPMTGVLSLLQHETASRCASPLPLFRVRCAAVRKTGLRAPGASPFCFSRLDPCW